MVVEWRLEDYQLVLSCDDVDYYPSWEEILEIEDKQSWPPVGSIPVPSKFVAVDYSYTMAYSSLKAKIYVPAEKDGRLPECQLFLEDTDYNLHGIPAIPESCYAVLDGCFLVFEKEQGEELAELLGSTTSGAFSYIKLSKIMQKGTSMYVEIIEDDDICTHTMLESLEKSKVRNILFNYQLQGVDWMDAVISEDTGFILADEMGLGKTVQVITVLDEQRCFGPSLLIAPNSLMVNWVREIKKFAPHITYFVHSGVKRPQYWKKLQGYDLIITSYDTARADFAIFDQIHWNLIILDEAQSIKNYGAKRSKAIKDFPKRSGIAVTGTPLENRLTDIWSLYDFCFPGFLGDDVKEFKEAFSEENAEKLEKIISPLMLRREVAKVRKDLPDKIIEPVALTMNPAEAEAYERCRTEQSGSGIGAITKLSRYCALPSLLDNSVNKEESAKYCYLFESLLDEIYVQKEKVLIFTQWLDAQEEIRAEVRSRYAAYCEVLNGNVPASERQTVVDEFSHKEGFALLILNPTVGGTGLNITAANHVIFYTLDWNPAMEDQCIGRAARIGQTKTVFVKRLYYVNTIEDEINSCLESKRQLFGRTIVGSDGERQPDISRALQLSPFTGVY